MLTVLACAWARSAGAGTAVAYGMAGLTAPPPFLNMPRDAQGPMPQLLSQTGVFSDVGKRAMRSGMIPYELIVPFWSDGALKSRWSAVPGKIGFAPKGPWRFPAGSVFVKTFELPLDESDPTMRRPLETRLLVRDAAGGVYGVTYKWRADGSDADLLPRDFSEELTIRTASGGSRRQTWYYPSREDCLQCHTSRAGGVLGLNTRQMNRPVAYASGVTDNQLRAWNHLALFQPAVTDAQLRGFDSLAAGNDMARSLEDRARSYLDANCSQCHQPGGTVANFDARYDTPLEQQSLIEGRILIDEGIDKPRVIAPHDIWRSLIYMRANTTSEIKMPPLARQTIDVQGTQLLREWIDAMPGREVLAPPDISPPGGMFTSPTEVALTSSEPGADIRYTLDGSVPGGSDARYEGPLRLTGPVVLRTRAFKEGFVHSITAQQTFIIGR